MINLWLGQLCGGTEQLETWHLCGELAPSSRLGHPFFSCHLCAVLALKSGLFLHTLVSLYFVIFETSNVAGAQLWCLIGSILRLREANVGCFHLFSEGTVLPGVHWMDGVRQLRHQLNVFLSDEGAHSWVSLCELLNQILYRQRDR